MKDLRDALSSSEQEQFNQWLLDGLKIGTNTCPIDREQVEKKLTELLKEYKLYTGQKFLFFPSINAVKQFLVENNRKDDLFKFISGSEQSDCTTFYRACEAILGVSNSNKKYKPVKYSKKDKHLLELWDNNVTKTTGWWWPFTNYILVSDRPVEINMETDCEPGQPPRLHCIGGPSVRYSDEYCIYTIRGVSVSKDIAMGNFSAIDIVKEQNQEVKRCMVDMYTPERLIRDLNATLLDKDAFGALYSADIGTSEPLMMVQVTDSTPQPNGVYKEYWLTVDPKAYGGLKKARAAVASTWRRKDGSFVFQTPEEYKPSIET